MTTFLIRPLENRDIAATATLFFRSVQEGAAAHYSAAERAAWAPAPPDPENWRNRLISQHVLVAEVDEGRIVGFMSRDNTGYLDLAFTDPDRAGQGVAAALYARLEESALKDRIARLSCDASLGLRPFLLRRGWTLLREQYPVRQGVTLRNFRMEKILTSP